MCFQNAKSRALLRGCVAIQKSSTSAEIAVTKELSLFPESPALEGNEWRQAVTPGRQRVLHAL